MGSAGVVEQRWWGAASLTMAAEARRGGTAGCVFVDSGDNSTGWRYVRRGGRGGGDGEGAKAGWERRARRRGTGVV